MRFYLGFPIKRLFNRLAGFICHQQRYPFFGFIEGLRTKPGASFMPASNFSSAFSKGRSPDSSVLTIFPDL
jgi:hypothetical protein